MDRNRKNKYLEYYREDIDGNTVYVGEYMICTNEPKEFDTTLKKCSMIAAVMAAVSIATGMMTDTGMDYHVLMLIPYAVGMVLDIILLLAPFKIGREGEKAREHFYNDHTIRYPAKALGATVAGIVALSDMAFCAFHATYAGDGIGMAVFLLSQIIQCAGGVVLIKVFTKLKWEKEKFDTDNTKIV